MSPHQGPKETVLSRLVQVRLADATALLKTGKPEQRNAAMYLSGYAVECALKSRLCRQIGKERLPPAYHRHDLRWLAERAGARQWARERREELSKLCNVWGVGLRYELRPWDSAEVRRFLGKTRELSRWVLK
ncbi:MAG: hypothetical protein ABSE73_32730 [Planctomycetota bacterium]